MMAIGIPLPQAPDVAFRNSANMGKDFYNMLIQHALQQQQNTRAESANNRANEIQPFNIKHLLAQTEGLQGANSRANQLLSPRLQALKDAHAKAMRESDPEWELKQFMHTMEALGKMGKGQPQPQPQPNNMDALKAKMMGQMPMGQDQNMSMIGQQLSEQQPNIQQEQTNPNSVDLSNLNDEQKAFLSTTKYKGLLNPTGGAYQGPARNAIDLERLKKSAGENSDVYQNAKADYDVSIAAKKDLRDLRARTKEGLKPGEKQFYDEKTGVPLGKEIPLTAKERESEEGNILFNELYPYVYKGGAPFSGEGSITRLENAARNYKTDPKARQLFDDFLLSDKMLAATTVNEASTLKSGKQNQTFNVLKESLTANDIPKLAKKFMKEYQIPASAQLNASMRYQKALSEARKKARKSTPATQKLFYDPEMQAQQETNQLEGAANNSSGGYKDTDLVQVEGPNGVETMTYAAAKKLGAQ